MSLRKATKARGSFPNDGAVFKLLYLAQRNIAKKWTMSVHDWKVALNRFAGRAGLARRPAELALWSHQGVLDRQHVRSPRRGDYGTAWAKRNEIYHLVRDAKITGFAIVSSDRHSFWAGYATAELLPGKFEPIGLSFIGGSLTSPGVIEAYEHRLPKDAPLRPLFLADKDAGSKPDWTFNMLLKHGVRACFEYAKSFDLKRARSLSNPDLAPHLAQSLRDLSVYR